MFDGWVGTLKDVRHVSDLRKNLLSLGGLGSSGYKFSGADGILKVTKGSMAVLKAERMENLYKVIESVIIGDAFVATKKENIVRIWHMRFGHMSERGIRALHNKEVLPGIKHCKLNLYKFWSIVAFTISVHKIKGLLDLVHTDIWGPSPVASVGVHVIMLFL